MNNTIKPSEVDVLDGLSRLLEYNPDNGVFLWKWRYGEDVGTKIFNSSWAGKPAGKREKDGYIRISLKLGGASRWVRAHRLAWFMIFGVAPKNEIDHINQNKSDNRISNLRDVPRVLNMRNRPLPVNNTSGHVGVTWSKVSRKWQAFGREDGVSKSLGCFSNKEDAAKVALDFRISRGYTGNHQAA